MKRDLELELEPNHLWRLAIHEAGHATIAARLNVCGRVTIIPDLDKGYFGACTIPFNEEKIGGFIAAMMAGALAEEEFFGELAGDDCRDRRDMLYIVSAARYHRRGFDCLPRLRPACRRLVRRHRDKIERVAQALLLRRTLPPDEVAALVK
jgi:ATP-dependent Zn protease